MSETRKTTSIKEVEIPNTPWLTLKQGAAYVHRGYPRFLAAMHRREFPAYPMPGTETQKRPDYRVHKDDLDKWVRQGAQRR